MITQMQGIIGAVGLATVVGAGFYVYGMGKDAGVEKERDRWELIVEAQEDALAEAEATIADLQKQVINNVEIRYVDRVRTVVETQVVNRDVIQEVYKESPFLPEGLVYAHDQLVENAPIDPELAANLAASPYTWETLLDVVAENYGVAIQGKLKDEAWNEFYDGVYRSYDDYRLPEGGSAGRTNNIPTATSTDSAD